MPIVLRIAEASFAASIARHFEFETTFSAAALAGADLCRAVAAAGRARPHHLRRPGIRDRRDRAARELRAMRAARRDPARGGARRRARADPRFRRGCRRASACWCWSRSRRFASRANLRGDRRPLAAGSVGGMTTVRQSTGVKHQFCWHFARFRGNSRAMHMLDAETRPHRAAARPPLLDAGLRGHDRRRADSARSTGRWAALLLDGICQDIGIARARLRSACPARARPCRSPRPVVRTDPEHRQLRDLLRRPRASTTSSRSTNARSPTSCTRRLRSRGPPPG